MFIRIGVLFVVLGFGSAILHFTDVQFNLLMWSEQWQPGMGIGLGGLGALLWGGGWMMGRRKEGAAEQPGQPYGPPPQQFGYQPPQQQFAPPAQQPYGQPAPYAQQYPQQFAPRPGPVPKFPPRPEYPPQPAQFGPGDGQFGPQGR
jgi:hypothetical protein